ncbi:MAG: sigma-70 family RNA polymerase sigma factor [Cyanobacteria bacterium P01_F01_bin.53]
MQIPTFPECDHDLVKSLIHHSDYALVDMLQKSPMDGKYFTALFCRYSPVVYSLIRHSAKSPVQAEYLFALTWRHILNELGGIDLSPIRQRQEGNVSAEADAEAEAITRDLAKDFSLQGWLINLTAAHINQAVLPDVESIHYSIADAPPPLWCYTERALESLSPMHRLIVLMAQTFEWSETRISAYLQAEGKQLSPNEVGAELQAAYHSLERAIPEDMRAIYLDKPTVLMPSAADALTNGESDGLLTIEFDNFDL